MFSLVNPGGDLHESVVRALENIPGGAPDRLIDEVQGTGSLSTSGGVSGQLRQVFTTALDISPIDHLLMASELQTAVDESIAKTINLPAHCATQDIAFSYQQAHALGMKGITVFRTGSRTVQPREVAKA